MANDYYVTKNPALGWFLYALTPLLCLAGFFFVAVSEAKENVLYGILGIAAIIGSGFCIRYARRWRTRIIRNLDALFQYVEDNDKRLILFLREFSSEGTVLKQDDGDIMRALFVTEEDVLADNLREYGIMVAIGRPGEQLPTSGASRLYVDDDRWKATVTSLIRRAEVIFLRCGDTTGLSWEMDQITEQELLERTVFIPLFTDPAKTVTAFRRIQQLAAPSDPEKTAQETNIEELKQLDIEDEELSALRDRALAQLESTQKLIEGTKDGLDMVGIAAPALSPTLFLMEAGRPVTFTGPLHQAITEAFEHIGIPRLKFTPGRFWAGLVLFLCLSPLFLFGGHLICEQTGLQACEAFYDAYGTNIFMALVAAIIMALSVTL